ncbi:MAG TPA: SHOCT domain-containing protein [Polyangiaceae bacterium]
MQQLTSDAERAIANLSDRYRVSQDAVRTLLFAVSNGGGSMAQFSHPELGGSGQWMRGGMTMVGDMFNYGLQGTVSGICAELSNLLASSTQVFLPLPRMTSGQQQQQNNNGFGSFGGYGGQWWPADLGSPSSSGGQNGSNYAYFPQARRLAVQSSNGQISVYDTLDHNIGGVQQQQGGPSGSQSFSSQFGTFTVESLPLVSGQGSGNPPPLYVENPMPQQPSYVQQPAQNYGGDQGEGAQGQGDVLATLERLGALRDKGILSEQEFQAKKADLLSRL